MPPENAPEETSDSGGDHPLASRLPELRVVLVGARVGHAGDVLANTISVLLVETVARFRALVMGEATGSGSLVGLFVRSGWLVAFALVLSILYQHSMNGAVLGGGARPGGIVGGLARFRRPFVGGLAAATVTAVLLSPTLGLVAPVPDAPALGAVLLLVPVCVGVIVGAYVDRKRAPA